MSIDKDLLLNKYIPFNIPVPYKDWEIHAIKVSDWYDVGLVVQVLEMDKNILGNIDFINMSNLQFFITIFSQDENYWKQFIYLLQICLGLPSNKLIRPFTLDKEYKIFISDSSGKNDYGIDIMDSNTLQIITTEDFDEIRKIILYQNLIDYDDKYVDPDVKKAADEYYRLKNKGVSVSMEHKAVCIQMKTGMSMEAIGNLTVRNFQLLFETIVDESEYMPARFAEFNGVKFKSPLEHWAYKQRKNKYEEAFCDADAFKQKVQSVN